VEGAGFVRAADLRAGDVLGSRRARVPSPVLAVVSRDDDVSGALVVKAITVRGRSVTPWAAFNLTVAQDHTFFVGTTETFFIRSGGAVPGADAVWVHNCTPSTNPKDLARRASDLESVLIEYGGKTFELPGGNSVRLTSDNVNHILARHHPDYWDGSTKMTQTFFDKSITIADIEEISRIAVTQAREELIRGNAMRQVTVEFRNKSYVVGFNKGGQIGQLYPQ
jgi:hypothetical protein